MALKLCTGPCKTLKDITLFSPRPDSPDGYRNKCRKCTKEINNKLKVVTVTLPPYLIQCANTELGCGVTKHKDEFYPCSTSKTGRQHKCKECDKSYLDKLSEIKRQEKLQYEKEHAEEIAEQKEQQRLVKEKQKRIKEEQKTDEEREQEKLKQQERYKNYYQNNTEIVKERSKNWAANNRTKVNGYSKKYRDAHKEEKRTWTQNRRAIQRSAKGSYTTQEWLDLKALYNNRCIYPGCDFVETDESPRLHRDHVISLYDGGTNWITNIQPLCGKHNSIKSRKSIDYRPLFKA